MKVKKSPEKVLRAELDVLFSEACKIIWGPQCAICGKLGTQAHHFFGKQAHPPVRFDIDNSCFLCFYCHIRRIHYRGETELARDAIIDRIGPDAFVRLKEKAYSSKPLTLLDLDRIKIELESILGQ